MYSVCVCVLQCGGDLSAKDGDGYTPLSILNEDRERFKSSLGKQSHNIHNLWSIVMHIMCISIVLLNKLK